MMRPPFRTSAVAIGWLAWFAAYPAIASGQSTWDGNTGGTGTSWAVASNWIGDALPPPGSNILFQNANAVAQLPGSMSVGADSTFGLITFDNIDGKLPSSLVVVTNGSGGTAARTLTINSGITLANSNTSVTFNAGTNGTLAFALGGNVAFSASPGGTLAINPVVSGSGRIAVQGGGTVVLNGANLFTGGVTLAGGSTLALGHANALGALPAMPFDSSLIIDGGFVRASPAVSLASAYGVTITPNGANLGAAPGANFTILGVIKESGGPSRLTIGNANAGTGQVILGANSNVAGGFSDGVTVQNGATLNIATTQALGTLPEAYDPDNVILNNGTLRANSASSGVVLAAVRGLTITPLGAALFSPTTSASLTVLSPILESGGASRLTASGGGLVVLGGASNTAGGFSGGISVTTAGTVLSVNSVAALGVPPATAVPGHLVLGAGTTFAYSNSGGALSATRGWQIGPSSGSGSATILLSRTVPGSTLHIHGVIADRPGGSGGLVVAGAGNVLTLTAANTYTGGTTVAGGTLKLDSPGVAGSSATGSGRVTVNSGGTLAGTGTIVVAAPNAVAIAAGGTLAPDSLSISGPTNFAPGSTLKVAVRGSHPEADGSPGSSSLGQAPAFGTNGFLNVTGTLTLDPNMQLVIDATGWNPTPGETYSYTVAQATSVAGIPPGYANRLTFDPPASTIGFATTPGDLFLFVGDGTFGDSNTVYVNFTAAVPEPTSILLLSAASLAVALRLRRRS
jgi:autotransporter-associated beta strand protein